MILSTIALCQCRDQFAGACSGLSTETSVTHHLLEMRCAAEQTHEFATTVTSIFRDVNIVTNEAAMTSAISASRYRVDDQTADEA